MSAYLLVSDYRAALSNRNITRDTNMSHIRHLSFSSGHIKEDKETDEINSNNIFCPIYPNYYFNMYSIQKYFMLFFLSISLQNPVCVLHRTHISIQTSYTASAQQPRMPSGPYRGHAGLDFSAKIWLMLLLMYVTTGPSWWWSNTVFSFLTQSSLLHVHSWAQD